MALLAIKKKKLYEAEMGKLVDYRMNLESQIHALETANINLEAYNAMKLGAESMKAIHGNLYVPLSSL